MIHACVGDALASRCSFPVLRAAKAAPTNGVRQLFESDLIPWTTAPWELRDLALLHGFL